MKKIKNKEELKNKIEQHILFIISCGAEGQLLNLNGYDLRPFSFQRARIPSANLMDADLSGCDFTGADLRFAFLSGANITGAIFNKAKMQNTELLDIDPAEQAKVKRYHPYAIIDCKPRQYKTEEYHREPYKFEIKKPEENHLLDDAANEFEIETKKEVITNEIINDNGSKEIEKKKVYTAKTKRAQRVKEISDRYR